MYHESMSSNESSTLLLFMALSRLSRGDRKMWGYFMGFAHKTPPQALPSTQNPKEPYLFVREKQIG